MAPHLTRIRLEHWLLSAILLLALGLRVAAIDYEVFSARARVPRRERARVAAAAWRRARRARRQYGSGRTVAIP